LEKLEAAKADSDEDERERKRKNISDLANCQQNIFAVDEIFDMSKARIERAISTVHKMTLPRTDKLYYHQKTDLNSIVKEKLRKDQRDLTNLFNQYSCLNQKNQTG